MLLGGWLLSGCSVKRVAVQGLGGVLTATSRSYAADNDPQLIKDAAPFSLKLMEAFLSEDPANRDLLLAAASGFTEYAYAFIQLDAEELEAQDFQASQALRARARKMYARAHQYAMRGLAVRHPNMPERLDRDPEAAVEEAGEADVPFLYWGALSLAAGISQSKDNPDMVADLPIVGALIDRALFLDEDFDHGAIHSFLISYEMARPGAAGDAADRAKQHFERAVALSGGHQASPFVTYAESVLIKKQDRKGFEAMLKRALAIDPDAAPQSRLMNVLAQRRAEWLLAHEDQFFVEPLDEMEKAK